MGKRLDNVRILRVVACIGVFAVHVGQVADLSGILRKITDFGEYGVYLFFIISGYLCFYNFGRCNYELSKKNYFTYLIKRILRIVPLYYAIIFLEIIIHVLFLDDVPKDNTGLYWIRYFLFLSRIVPTNVTFWNNLCATWTISVFLMFYIVAPFFWKILRKFWNIPIFFCGLWGSSMLIWKCFGYMLEPIRYLYFFVLGIGIYFAQKEKKENIYITFICVLLIVQSIHVGQFNMNAYAFVFAILLMGLENISIKDGIIQKILGVLDGYSYTLYLSHAVIIDLIYKMNLQQTDTISGKIQVVMMTLVGTIVLCIIMKQFVEKPVEKYIGILLKSKC